MQMALSHFRELPPETRAEQRSRVIAAVHARRRRPPLIAIAIALAVIVVAPTFAFQRELVDFFSAEPAPGPIQLDFDRLKQAQTGQAWRPVGTAREVMNVSADGETRPLWVIPTEDGGYCWRWHHLGSCAVAGEPRKLALFGRDAPAGGGSAVVVGDVRSAEIEAVQVEDEDGRRGLVRYVWVSPPIDAGFFAFEVPQENRVPGHRAAYVLGLDGDGRVVERVKLPLPPPA